MFTKSPVSRFEEALEDCGKAVVAARDIFSNFSFVVNTRSSTPLYKSMYKPYPKTKRRRKKRTRYSQY